MLDERPMRPLDSVHVMLFLAHQHQTLGASQAALASEVCARIRTNSIIRIIAISIPGVITPGAAG